MTQPRDAHPPDDNFLVANDDYKAATGESIERTLDLTTWQTGVDLGALYQRLEAEVGPALEQERRVQNVVRSEIFPLLRQAPDAPTEAGVHQAKAADLEDVHRKVLFSGQLDTCDGTTATHDTLLLTVTQIGVCLISYQGNELALSQQISDVICAPSARIRSTKHGSFSDDARIARLPASPTSATHCRNLRGEAS